MRTTLTIDPDVAVGLRMEMQTRGSSFKETVNALLRMGLETARQPSAAPKKRFVVRAKPLGTGLGERYPKVADLLERAEGESFR